MMIIAAGLRQIHIDVDGERYVLFDQGIYKLPKHVTVKRKDGSDWVYCEAHADEQTGEGWAEIGGIKMELVYDPDVSADGGHTEMVIPSGDSDHWDD